MNNYKIINLQKNETGESPYIRKVLAFQDYNDHIIIVTDRYVYKGKQKQTSHQPQFSIMYFLFTPILFLGNKLYIIGFDGNDETLLKLI